MKQLSIYLSEAQVGRPRQNCCTKHVLDAEYTSISDQNERDFVNNLQIIYTNNFSMATILVDYILLTPVTSKVCLSVIVCIFIYACILRTRGRSAPQPSHKFICPFGNHEWQHIIEFLLRVDDQNVRAHTSTYCCCVSVDGSSDLHGHAALADQLAAEILQRGNFKKIIRL